MKLSIGEVSNIFNISRETLRYYDKIGILTPEIDTNNKYRYYQFKHLEKLSLVLGIKLLGISLSDIRETIESEDLNKYKNLVLKQEEFLNIKKKELQQLEYNLNKSKKILNTITDFKNEYDFKNLKISEQDYNLYAIDMKNILNSNLSKNDNLTLEKELSDLNEETEDTYVYIYNIIENTHVKEDDDTIFIKENKHNISLLKKYLKEDHIKAIREDICGKTVSVNFYGTVAEINNYILSLNKYFKCPRNNSAYVTYEFYLPRKNEDVMYFVNIDLKI
ncbi:MerR family transcriptional regulator [Clostridium sp. CCUG 7971]|uniref:MerR family transcriptional regulator n=1 Tax=Clostridium sp. CCUG 7971 TaxID=2811414 RepID=UPI001ABA2266|nr:MerR family transcriptional regulator [Clostridium sp. CCUG 7971]MBO3445460.1 MerR family transcriptional regulator [Clostridium sp. CCUG 7971]